MKMTTARLIALRVYVLTVGRSRFGGRLLRRLLVKNLVTSRLPGKRYVSSARFFDPREL